MSANINSMAGHMSYPLLLIESSNQRIPLEFKTLQEWKAYSPTPAEKNWLTLQKKRIEKSDYFYIANGAGQVERVVMVWDPNNEDPRSWIWLAARLGQELPPGDYELQLREGIGPEQVEQLSLGWGLSAYQFRKYLKVDEQALPKPRLLVSAELRARTQELLEAIFLTRDLVNTPAADMGPDDIVQVARDLAQKFRGQFSLLQGQALLESNYPAIYHVGKGSARAPSLIDLQWGASQHPLVCLVGKGVAFDSGGLNIKPERGMLLMKKDMGGAAIVLGLAQLIMTRKLPVRLRVLIPTVENMISGSSFRPGDVVPTRKGLTVEITNTDAEGRVILADALTEAVASQPDLVIDVATLTGACRVALGEDLPGFFTKSEALAEKLIQASQKAADPMWRLPLWTSYKSALRSPIADMNNSAASGFAGAIHAALFLGEFVGDFKNWVHLDAYAWVGEARPGFPGGGEATALRALYTLIESSYLGR